MMHPRTLILALGIAIVGTAVWAHDGHDHIIMGTVMAREVMRLEVRTPSGEVLSIAVTDKTTTTRDKKKIAFKDVEVGRRVVVNIGNGEDPLVARDIQVGVAPAAPAAGRH
jgi:hypothetical protein